jgi:damage-control phosphatase, subfamily II, stand-alone protein
MTPNPAPAVAFPLLADPAGYVACRWDFTREAEKREYWLRMYREHFPHLLEEAERELLAQGRPAEEVRRTIAGCGQDFNGYLDQLREDPGRWGRLDMLQLTLGRERVLRRAGIDDPYRVAKRRENEAALSLLPGLLAELDAMAERERAVSLVEGMLAGNIFDLGATSITARVKTGRVDFHAVRAELAPRPWLIDDLDRWVERLTAGPAYRGAVLFVDNSGADVVLGMLPFARELLRRGAEVLLAANTGPALNDVTAAELGPLVAGIAKCDATFAAAIAAGRLEVAATGCITPLIDLGGVAPGFAAAVRRRPVDLVVLEGMGRAIESNLDAAFTCDAMKIAMLKIEGVARWLGGKVYDLVLRFEGAGGR